MKLRNSTLRTCLGATVWVWSLTMLTLCLAPTALADYTTHSVLQAVDSNGNSTFIPPSFPDESMMLKGIVLNNPADMLNGTFDAPGFMGGQWQVFIQATESGDSGGTALWMGQKYGNLPTRTESYTESVWNAEMLRLNYPVGPGGGNVTEHLRAGDLIEVEAHGSLFYGGKRNVNEEHWTDSDYDFDITILQRGTAADLPTPNDITLADVKDAEDEFIFDQTRQQGGEAYQATRVRLKNVSLVDPLGSGWGLDETVMVTDGDGLTFPMHLGINESLATMPAELATMPFDVVGIFNQEDGSSPFTGGYELWVMNAGDFRPVPEPGSLVLLVSGALVLLACRRKIRRKST